MEQNVETLQSWIDESDNVVFFSGAGLSAESGFPDFRETDSLYYEKHKDSPDTILSRSFLLRRPFDFFKFYRERVITPLLAAAPNAAHLKLAELEQAGKLKAVITQNIDGLHQEAGSREVLELQGSVMRSYCLRCDRFLSFFYIAESPAVIPYCNVDMCGDVVRPCMVLHEEPLDLSLLQKAAQIVQDADVLILDGTALKSFPAPNLVNYYQGKKLVLIHPTPLFFDTRANLVIHAALSEVMGQIQVRL